MAKAVWAVLMSRDVQGAMHFYTQTLGWRFDRFCGEPYPTWIARNLDNRSVAAFVDSSQSDFPDASELWLPYLVVTNLDAGLLCAEEAGATVLRPPFSVPDVGRVAILRQPGGGIVGWVTSSRDT